MKCKAYLSLPRLAKILTKYVVCITGPNHNSNIFFACFKTGLHHCPLASSLGRVAKTLVVLIYARHPAMQVSFERHCCVVLRPLQNFRIELYPAHWLYKTGQLSPSLTFAPKLAVASYFLWFFLFQSESTPHTRTIQFRII